MSDDSTRIKTHEKVVGLHYNDFQCPAPCNDSASASTRHRKSLKTSPVGKVGLTEPPAGNRRGLFFSSRYEHSLEVEVLCPARWRRAFTQHGQLLYRTRLCRECSRFGII